MSTKKPKPNPEPSAEFVTVRLPKELPKGVEYRYDAKRGGGWRISGKKALKAFFELMDRGALR